MTRKPGDVVTRCDEALWVELGDNAVMSVPRGDLDWQLRYGDPKTVRFIAASVIESFDYIIRHCTKDEVWRRIKLARSALSD